jgi:ceramide glucosyltransferase
VQEASEGVVYEIVWLGRGLLALGAFGLLTSTVFLGMVVVGAVRFRQAALRELRQLAEGQPYLPAVTLFKPLHGAEPALDANLRSFFEQDYFAHVATAGLDPHVAGISRVEMLFCARHLDDDGLRIARAIAAEYPLITSRFVSSGEPWAPNAKVCSLAAMADVATHDLWVIADSDVRVGPEYLRSVVLPFADAAVGASTCLYRGRVLDHSLWSRLEAVGMTVEMSSGVSVVNLLEPMSFTLGPTMIARRHCIAEVGGFRAMADYCADDFVLGNWIAAKGYRVALSSYPIDHMVPYAGLIDSIKHQVRWMKSTRYSRPKGHFGTSMTFGVPFGILAWAGALLLGLPQLAWGALAFSILGRSLQAWVMATFVVRKSRSWPSMILFPIRDLMGMLYWALSYTGNQILWRGEMYDLLEGGRMVKSADKLAKLKRSQA